MARVITGGAPPKPKKPRSFGKTPEGLVKSDIAVILHRVAQEYPLSYHCPVPCGFGQAGVSDFVCCVAGRYLEIEAKSAVGEQSKLQKQHQAEVEASGGVYFCISPRNMEKLYDAIVKLASEV